VLRKQIISLLLGAGLLGRAPPAVEIDPEWS
jgi:hypothetical protein